MLTVPTILTTYYLINKPDTSGTREMQDLLDSEKTNQKRKICKA
jgi:hypothetical protein